MQKREIPLPLICVIEKRCLFQCREAFHQAALAAGGVILVKNTLLCRFVQRRDGFQGGCLGGFCVFAYDSSFCAGNERARFTAINAVAYTPFFVLLVTFYC